MQTDTQQSSTPAALCSMRLLGDGQSCDDCGGRIGTTCGCPIAQVTDYLFQGIPAQRDQWATIACGTLEKITTEKREYENETGLAWRGYRLVKRVTTYHTNVEPPNDPSSATGAGRKVRTTLWADNHIKQSSES